MESAPIALFTYNRLRHTQETIAALRENEGAGSSELYIFSDGPRSAADREKVRGVREYLATVTGFGEVTIIEREENLGLAQSVIAGVTEVVGRCGRVIVLEDDMVTSPYFLRFMNEALALYKNEEKVISISGYTYPVTARLPETFFLKGADCWGWATWERGWDLFEPNGRKLLNELKSRHLVRQFNFDGAYDYAGMLQDQIAGRNDSWAIRWYASAFLWDKLTLYPGRTLLRNIGHDSSGTHSEQTDIYETELSRAPIRLGDIPVEESATARREIGRFLRSTKPGLVTIVKRKLRKLQKG